MIGGYQIISLHNNNNAMGTSYSIKGLYKRVKKSIKQIKLEDLIVDGIKMENVFINVHLDDTKYIGTFGLYQITFNSDDTYIIEENSSGSSGLYFVETNSYDLYVSSNTPTNYNFSNYPQIKQLFIDLPSMAVITKIRIPVLMSDSTKFYSEGTNTNNVMFYKVSDTQYQTTGYYLIISTYCRIPVTVITKVDDDTFTISFNALLS